MTTKKEKALCKKYSWLLKSGGPIPFPMFGFECGDGWYALLDDLLFGIDRVLTGNPELAKDFFVSQIKEKFGSLRFYYYGGDDEIDALVRAAEIKSEKVCEVCGKAGMIRGVNGWLTCLCPKCHKKKEAKK